MDNRIFQIAPSLHEYLWGDKRSSSLVGVLTATDVTGKPTNRTGPFAEAIFGPQSKVAPLDGSSVCTLAELVAKDPKYYLGARRHPSDGEEFGLLCKFLDAKLPLSIQVHPPQGFAAQYFSNGCVKDSAIKDEAIVVISETASMVLGFKTTPDLLEVCREYPAVDQFLKGEGLDIRSMGEDGASLARAITGAILHAHPARISKVCSELLPPVIWRADPTTTWLRKLIAQFPEGDTGIVLFPFLNLLELNRGDSVSLCAGEIHAYLEGLLAEPQRSSDAVLRCGLTPKEKHPEQILECSIFEPKIPHIDKGQAVSGAVGRTRYLMPHIPAGVDIFEGSGTDVLKGAGAWIVVNLDGVAELTVPGLSSPVVLQDHRGYFIPAGSFPLTLTRQSGQLVAFHREE